jgi:hypothetical protein
MPRCSGKGITVGPHERNAEGRTVPTIWFCAPGTLRADRTGCTRGQLHIAMQQLQRAAVSSGGQPEVGDLLRGSETPHDVA